MVSSPVIILTNSFYKLISQLLGQVFCITSSHRFSVRCTNSACYNLFLHALIHSSRTMRGTLGLLPMSMRAHTS